MEHSFVVENARQRERLRALIARSQEADLARPLHDDWTVAVALAHLAFWDQRAFNLLKNYKKSGQAFAPPAVDSNSVNDALAPIARALKPRAAADLALSAAEAADGEIASASDELIKNIASLGLDWLLNRSKHRRMHLDEIEAATR